MLEEPSNAVHLPDGLIVCSQGNPVAKSPSTNELGDREASGVRGFPEFIMLGGCKTDVKTVGVGTGLQSALR